MQSICVIGSLNVDLTVTLPRFHQPGETVTGSDFRVYPGGKGGNQAVAAARLGARVHMVGEVGDDGNGAFYREVIAKEGIGLAHVKEAPGVPTGVALIEVDPRGENRIAVVPGANALVNRAQVDAALAGLPGLDAVMLQLEIPMDTVVYAAQACAARAVLTILDPAPAVPLRPELLRTVDYLTPNESELALLSGMPTDTLEKATEAAKHLLRQGVRHVVAKLGRSGCLYVSDESVRHVPGYSVDVVDTTAAGDSFNAGLAYGLCGGMSIEQALRFANAVGALSTTKAGAQAAMPTLAAVEQLLA